MKQFKNIEKDLLTSEHLKKLQYSSNNLQHIFVPNYVCSLGFQYLSIHIKHFYLHTYLDNWKIFSHIILYKNEKYNNLQSQFW